jgi:hypothetical protein
MGAWLPCKPAATPASYAHLHVGATEHRTTGGRDLVRTRAIHSNPVTISVLASRLALIDMPLPELIPRIFQVEVTNRLQRQRPGNG